MKSVDECIIGYLEQIESRKNVDYADRDSVCRYNAAYDDCFRFAKYIDDHYPEQLNLLVALLEHPDADVVGHCAPMLLRLQHATEEQKAQAIGAIYKLLERPEVDDVTKLGFSMSLGRWEKELVEETSPVMDKE